MKIKILTYGNWWAVYIEDIWTIFNSEKTISKEDTYNLKEFFYYNFFVDVDFSFEEIEEYIDIVEID
jgi:hypothetical protein